MSYTTSVTSESGFEETVERVEDALDDEGFGVLCDIDVRATFAEKLGVDFENYRILGACNPALAHEGLETEPDLGALLPCNVVVYESDGDVTVSAVDPTALIGVTENHDLDHIADDVAERFERVLDAVSA